MPSLSLQGTLYLEEGLYLLQIQYRFEKKMEFFRVNKDDETQQPS